MSKHQRCVYRNPFTTGPHLATSVFSGDPICPQCRLWVTTDAQACRFWKDFSQEGLEMIGQRSYSLVFDESDEGRALLDRFEQTLLDVAEYFHNTLAQVASAD